MKKQKKTFIQDPLKAGLSAAVAVFFLFYAFYYLWEGLLPGTLVFGVFGTVFLVLFLQSTRTLTISDIGIVYRTTLRRKKLLSWKDIQEVGVLGSSFFPSRRPTGINRKFLYFSNKPLDEDGRFDMLLRWPSPSIPYVIFTRKCYDLVQTCWKGNIFFIIQKKHLTSICAEKHLWRMLSLYPEFQR